MNFFIKLFTRFNAFLLRATRGRLGGQLGRQSILILTSTGRRSGQPRETPLSYYRDGTHYLVVASNWGKDVPPDWLLNLEKQPRGAILVNGRRLPVVGRPAEGDEQTRLWKLVTDQNGQFLDYQKQTARRIPVVVLTPLDAA
jgi:F420H(2)-dependent quinone reductase